VAAAMGIIASSSAKKTYGVDEGFPNALNGCQKSQNRRLFFPVMQAFQISACEPTAASTGLQRQ